MLVDIVNAGWAPVYLSNLTEDIPGYVEAHANALAYPWKHYIGGHLGRLGTRDDVTLPQQDMAELAQGCRQELDTVDQTPYFVKYDQNRGARCDAGRAEPRRPARRSRTCTRKGRRSTEPLPTRGRTLTSSPPCAPRADASSSCARSGQRCASPSRRSTL